MLSCLQELHSRLHHGVWHSEHPVWLLSPCCLLPMLPLRLQTKSVAHLGSQVLSFPTSGFTHPPWAILPITGSSFGVFLQLSCYSFFLFQTWKSIYSLISPVNGPWSSHFLPSLIMRFCTSHFSTKVISKSSHSPFEYENSQAQRYLKLIPTIYLTPQE